MLDTVWHISSKGFDVSYFVKHFGVTGATRIFREGEIDRKGKIGNKSGFNFLISDNINSDDNVNYVVSYITSNEAEFKYLMDNNIPNTIDIGCSVGTGDQFMKSVVIPQNLIELLNQFKITLEFSAYPGSEESEK